MRFFINLLVNVLVSVALMCISRQLISQNTTKHNFMKYQLQLTGKNRVL